tara:strand:+ start:3433 stop:3906 length:474 start_codon:yes stop_codon:yes gene_type:complete
MFTNEQLQELKNSQQTAHLNRLGILDNYNKYENVNYSKLNPKQHFLFKRVLHGLKLYKKEEINKMHWDKKRRIIKVWKRSQHVINKWKQRLCHNKANAIFAIFTHSKSAKELIAVPFEYMPDFKNKMSLKDCGIEYEHLIIKFIEEGLLPGNYFNIK